MVKTDLNGLGKWSNTLIELICDQCNSEKTIKYKLYTSYGYEDGNYLCRSCKLKKNNLEKWGVENVFQLNDVKEKSKKTNLEKFGVEFVSQSIEIKEKIKNSFKELDKDLVNTKRRETLKRKWNVDNVSQLDSVKDKKKEKYYKNWNSTNNKKSEIFRKNNFKISQNENYVKYIENGVSLFRCDVGEDHLFEIGIDVYSKRIKYKTTLCTVCSPVGKHQSGKEIALFNFIKSIYDGEIIQNYKQDRKEIDIYLPYLKLGFEFNGVFWHSEEWKEKKFHSNKSKFFTEKSIRIIHIWEDDWDSNENIIKSQITNWIGLSNKIWARNCSIREVQTQDAIKFLNENHIQGTIGSNIKIGLYHVDELVSIMTFDNLEGRKRMSPGNWNLSRFCNKKGYTIVGGASKLLKHFTKTHSVKRIISYSDSDWSIGGLYEKLGFVKISESGPDYKYVVNGKRIHKSNFKSIEKQTTYPKIWDCGKIKWEIIFVE